MQAEKLLDEIFKFLDESPFDDEDILAWKEKLPDMDEQQIADFYKLLKERLVILENTNQLFVNFAEQAADIRGKELPKNPSLVDKTIEDLEEIFKTNLVTILKSKSINIFLELNRYFKESTELEENIAVQFEALVKSIGENQEILFPQNQAVNRITIGQWLAFYNQYNDSAHRKSIDRMNFINQKEEIKRLSSEEKSLLLKFLKLDDYLLNPENFDSNAVAQETDRMYAATPAKNTENKKLKELQEIAEQFAPGTLERRAVDEEIRKIS